MSKIMRKIPVFLFFFSLMLAAFLNMGTVRKKENAVIKTQTAPIKLKDKLEEIKDGEKGPATPTFGWYGGKNGFMGAPPFEKSKASTHLEPPPPVSEVDLSMEDQVLPSAAETPADSPDFIEEDEGGGGEEDWEDDESLPAKADTEGDALPAAKEEDGDQKKWDKDWWDEI